MYDHDDGTELACHPFRYVNHACMARVHMHVIPSIGLVRPFSFFQIFQELPPFQFTSPALIFRSLIS